jgi:hypothetical protein
MVANRCVHSPFCDFAEQFFFPSKEQRKAIVAFLNWSLCGMGLTLP